MGEGLFLSIEIIDGVFLVKVKKGCKSKSLLVLFVFEGFMLGFKFVLEISSIMGEGLSVKIGDVYDGDGIVGDDISVLSLDEGKLLFYV